MATKKRKSGKRRKARSNPHRSHHGGRRRKARSNPAPRRSSRRRRNPGMPKMLKGALIASGLALGVSVVALGGEFLIANVIKPASPTTSAIAYGVSGLLIAMGFGMLGEHGVAAGIVGGGTFIASALATLAAKPATPANPPAPTQGLGSGLSRDLMGRVLANDMGSVLANDMGNVRLMQPRVSGLTGAEIAYLKDHGRRLGLSDSQISSVISMNYAA